MSPELDAIMLAHVEFPNIDPDFPASLSPRIIRRFLRDPLGFHHPLVWSDKKWQETCDSLARLAAEVPEIETPQANSPVADY